MRACGQSARSCVPCVWSTIVHVFPAMKVIMNKKTIIYIKTSNGSVFGFSFSFMLSLIFFISVFLFSSSFFSLFISSFTSVVQTYTSQNEFSLSSDSVCNCSVLLFASSSAFSSLLILLLSSFDFESNSFMILFILSW